MPPILGANGAPVSVQHGVAYRPGLGSHPVVLPIQHESGVELNIIGGLNSLEDMASRMLGPVLAGIMATIADQPWQGADDNSEALRKSIDQAVANALYAAVELRRRSAEYINAEAQRDQQGR